MRRLAVSVLVGTLACAAMAVGSASASTNVNRHIGPIAGKQRVGHDLFYSTNWSGYVADNRTFNSASGTWQMPEANCSAVKGQKETVATFFIGLDGFNSGTVEQTGVDAICIGKTEFYEPWYEFYPEAAVFSNNPVSPRDNLTADVSVSSDGSTVTTTLSDPDQGWTLTSPEHSTAGLALNSADWIVESPAHALTNYGSVTYGSASATNSSGHTGTISDDAWNHDELIMVKGRRIISQPGNLFARGASFSVDWMGL
jgi:peptidase A4-like protein